MSLQTNFLFAEGLQVSGGVDSRVNHETRSDHTEAELHGLFLNLRKVWSDETGDRWIGVSQIDFDDNFSDIHPYQVYLQYKGPLAKWNLRAGHYLLPFGLLSNYDTERLLLQGLEEISLGIRKDTGAELFGRVGDWDYAVSVTEGLGDAHFIDSRANPLLSSRVAYVQDDWQVGLSTLIGQVVFDGRNDFNHDDAQERRFALDTSKSWGPLTLHAEGIGGTENGEPVGGGIALADYALTDKLELNTRYAYWHGAADYQFAGIGLSYQILQGLFVRFSDNYEFGHQEKNTLTAQIYFEFTHRF